MTDEEEEKNPDRRFGEYPRGTSVGVQSSGGTEMKHDDAMDKNLS